MPTTHRVCALWQTPLGAFTLGHNNMPWWYCTTAHCLWSWKTKSSGAVVAWINPPKSHSREDKNGITHDSRCSLYACWSLRKIHISDATDKQHQDNPRLFPWGLLGILQSSAPDWNVSKWPQHLSRPRPTSQSRKMPLADFRLALWAAIV